MRPAADVEVMIGESFSRRTASHLCVDIRSTRTGAYLDHKGTLNMIAIYLIAAAVAICGCLLFVTRARSRD
jgi:hypothetical protein